MKMDHTFRSRPVPLSGQLSDQSFESDRPTHSIAGSRIGQQLAIEAAKARALGKPITQALMISLARVLPSAPALLRCLIDWPGDLAADAVVFRLNAGLHALFLAGKAPQLAPIYGSRHEEQARSAATIDEALRRTLSCHEDEIAAWLSHSTQTNEVARAAGFVAVLRELNGMNDMPSEVLEIGCSAGLNLNFPNYHIETGAAADWPLQAKGQEFGQVTITPHWTGPAVGPRPIAVERTAGVDLKPLNLCSPADCQRLRAYIWPDDHLRQDRLLAAIELAQRIPPPVEQGHAGPWLDRELAAPQREGVRRVIIHSMVTQYIDPVERRVIDRTIRRAGERATPTRPLVRIGFEWREDRSRVELTVLHWDGRNGSGAGTIAAYCHPYGEWFEWLGLMQRGVTGLEAVG